MWLRNIVCSVITIAGFWALAFGWRSISNGVGATESFGGLAALWGLVAIFGTACYFIARTVDARAERRRGEKVR